MYGDFLWKTEEIAHDKSWTWLRKRNLKRETEFLLIATQNKTIKTNYIKTKIDYTQQNCKEDYVEKVMKRLIT